MTREALTAWLLAALASWAFIAIAQRTRWASRLADHPNERSLHSTPIPRLGGLGVIAAGLGASAVVASGSLAVVLACALALSLLSLVDDLRSLPIEVRLPAHIAAAVAAWAAWSFQFGATGWPEALVAIFAMVWMTNLFNFMDGSDGLAGGMATIGLATFAFAAAEAGSVALAWTCGAIAAASLGFLVHNFPPARVFLGDAGSVPLGFLAAALGIHGIFAGAWPAWFPVVVFSPFIVDATVTILRRLARGERIWIAHREHYYQRLVLAGCGRRQLALGAYALMVCAAAAALAARGAGTMLQCGIILACVALFAALLSAIDRRAPRGGPGRP